MGLYEEKLITPCAQDAADVAGRINASSPDGRATATIMMDTTSAECQGMQHKRFGDPNNDLLSTACNYLIAHIANLCSLSAGCT